ncbi:MAG TPA: hypothetical protein VFK52_02410 [Nocardioidaceae bacterium]|nr:hypothetical protein [Nocardioidaceae bacterium]
MSTTTKVLGFAAALALVFAAALGLGRAVGPVAAAPSATHAEGGHEGTEAPEGETAPPALPKGLLVSQDGYTLKLAQTSAQAGNAVPLTFQVLGPDGTPATEYELTHEKELHLIAVRRDFSGFQHVHPEMETDGTWGTSLALTPGQWRLFADFQASGAEALTLGADLAVSGPFTAQPPAPETRTSVVDGYTVTVAGDLEAGSDARLTLSVSRDGEPVTDLEPYLGAFGHLVALREGDLAYLHVHPEGTPGDGETAPGPDIVFYAEVPSANGYRLYLDFKHEGTVRTASFAVSSTDPTSAGSGEESDGDPHADDDH